MIKDMCIYVMSCLSETILSSISVHTSCFYSLFPAGALFLYLCTFRGTLTLSHVSCSSQFSFQLTFYQLHNLHVVWARHQSPVNLKTTIREQLKEVENKEETETNRSHLNDPISRLDSSPHRRSICDTEHRGGATGTQGKGQTRVAVSLTFLDQLNKDGIVSTHSQPKAIFISLDYHTALDKTWTHTNTHLGGHKQARSPSHHIFGKTPNF